MIADDITLIVYVVSCVGTRNLRGIFSYYFIL